jgi:hypothetical protein
MSIRRKHIILATIVFAAIGAYFGARYGMDQYRDYLADKEYAAKIDIIRSHIPEAKDESFHTKADRLHNFIRANSQYKMDEEFYATWPDRMKLADAFIAGLEGKRKDKPHMECSTRSNILAALFEKEGYRTRNVVLYNPEESLNNHRLIEVLNPETKNWEAYDVTYDVYYKNKETGERAGIAAIGANPEAYEPCNTKGKCGWALETDDKQNATRLVNLLKIATINDPETGLRLSLRAADIDTSRVYRTAEQKAGTFCDLFGKNCKQGFKPYAEGLAATTLY